MKFNSAIDVDSAGTHAYYKVLDVSREYLRRHGAEQHLKRTPQDLNSKRLNEYDLIVAMEPQHRNHIVAKCPECTDNIVVWNITDPYRLPAALTEQIFDQIRRKTKELADSM